ncbi:hypothetical protein DL96DRAFT_1600242 [Flagelloscypha sp. PMI_526]|nr:hypothetical protein DL96DRAFT_1600242 [Flagelloscypha sp. PMI_526]
MTRGSPSTYTIPIPPPSPFPRDHQFPVQGIYTSGELEATSKAVFVTRCNLKTIEAQIAALNAAYLEHESFLMQHVPLVSPRRHMPPELWQEIFQWLRLIQLTCEEEDDTVFTCLQHGPFVASHVCKEWRRIALSSPRLWSTIRLRIDKKIPIHTTDLLSLWLERSGRYPLNLDVKVEFSRNFEDSWHPCSPSLMRDLTAILYCLAVESRRWKDIVLHLPVAFYQRNLSIFPLVTPLLERAHFSSKEAAAETALQWFLIDASKLRQISLQNLTVGHESQWQTLFPLESFPALREITLPTSSENCLQYEHKDGWYFLETFPDLQRAYLCMAATTPRFEALHELVHENLVELIYSSFEGNLLQNLSCPNLRCLQLSFLNSSEAKTICEFISRSPKIETLSIYGPCEFLCTVQSTSIKTLVIKQKDNRLPELLKVMREILCTSRDDLLLPALTSLDIWLFFHGPKYEDVKELLEVLAGMAGTRGKNWERVTLSVQWAPTFVTGVSDVNEVLANLSKTSGEKVKVVVVNACPENSVL